MEGDRIRRATPPACPISIHALRVEGDTSYTIKRSDFLHFYPRPPGGGRRCATQSIYRVRSISIHALRVEGDRIRRATPPACPISIHALRVEGDTSYTIKRSDFLHFYPRPPGGGRRCATQSIYRVRSISIHALRVEGDLADLILGEVLKEFLSTPSGWRATRRRVNTVGAPEFLSTPSGWRATPRAKTRKCRQKKFLSTPSGWRATAFPHLPDYAANISIHALRVEGDQLYQLHDHAGREISIHALRVEGDCTGVHDNFLSR